MAKFNSRAPNIKDKTTGRQVTHANVATQPAASRADETKVEGSNLINVGVGLYSIDETLISFLNTKIKPSVVQDDVQVPVPVLYANAERWKSVQKDGILRDKQGKVQLPVILLRRTSLSRNALNNPVNKYHGQSFSSKWNKRNAYDRFAVVNGVNPSQELINVTMPDYYDLSYDVIVWTEYIAQLNTLIEQISFETEDYWGERNKYKFLVSVKEYKTDNSFVNNHDRIVKCTFTMTVKAYLLPQTMLDTQRQPSSTTKSTFTTKKIVFSEEIVSKL